MNYNNLVIIECSSLSLVPTFTTSWKGQFFPSVSQL